MLPTGQWIGAVYIIKVRYDCSVSCCAVTVDGKVNMFGIKLKILAAVTLLVLGAVMIFLGVRAGILPPTVTGIGFFVIAAVFLFE